MSTKHTSNYALSQWEASDPVVRVEFNADNQKIDDALAALETKKADTSALAALQTAIDSKASSASVSTLSSQLNSAKASIPKIVSTSYTGSGTYGKNNLNTVSLDSISQPYLLIVRPVEGDGNALVLLYGMTSSCCHLSGSYGSGYDVTVTWSSRQVSWYASNASAQMNESGKQYRVFMLGV